MNKIYWKALLWGLIIVLAVNLYAQKPPEGNLPAQVLAGCGVGVLSGLAGSYIGAFVFSDGEGWGDLLGAALGGVLGYTIGTAHGVYMVGSSENVTGSYAATLGGSFLGLLLAYPVSMINIGDTPISMNIAYFIAFIGPPVGATIGFNLTRRYRTPPTSETGLINFRAGGMYLAVPTIYMVQYPYDETTLVQSIDLIRVEF